MPSLLFAILFALLTKPTFAQESTPSAQIESTQSAQLFDQYKKDYQFQVKTYQDSYSKYLSKKQINLQYGTATTKNDEFLSLKQATIDRNKMVKAYLMAIRVRLNEYKTNNPEETQKAQDNLSQTEQWLDEQNQKLDTISVSSGIETLANDFKEKYYNIQKFIYTALVDYRLNLNTQTLTEITDLRNIIQSQPQNLDQNKIYYDEIESKSQSFLLSQQNAFNLTKKESVVPIKFLNFYPDATIELDNAKKYLSEIFADLKTIITKINN